MDHRRAVPLFGRPLEALKASQAGIANIVAGDRGPDLFLLRVSLTAAEAGGFSKARSLSTSACLRSERMRWKREWES